FGYVVEGQYELGINGGPTRMLKAGDTFYEPPGALHSVSRNASATQQLKIVVFMVADASKPSTVNEKEFKEAILTPAPLFIAIVLIAAETPAADPNDPWAPARSGKLQCYTPNVAKKTCHALAQYNFAPDGGIENPAEVIISEKPLIIMKGTAPVVVRDGA